LKIALIQQPATPSRDANRAQGLASVREAAANGARLVCFAELAFDPFYPQNCAAGDVSKLAEPIPGPATAPFQELAAELGIVIVLNLFELDEGKTYDSSPVINADGNILGVTRMVHITDYDGFHEQGYYTPGDRGAPVYETACGKVGVAICYDRHYPEYMRALGVAGADLVIVPQAGATGEWPEGLYEAELQVAAFQNGYFTALCNRVGKEPKLDFAGESFVCNTAGEVIARAGTGSTEILYCDIDLAAVGNSHARRLFLRDRRPKLYADWILESVR
jgi:predicted amidohydrolase